MTRQPQKKLFGLIFLCIFFAKMVISLAPVLAEHIDSKVVNAVIMQLEIENSSKDIDDKVKENTLKDYIDYNQLSYCFYNRILYLASQSVFVDDDAHIQTFYPVVPTPPPNA